jgi:hypothetical protein
MKTSLRIILGKILDRVPASSGATVVIRKNSIEITTMAALRKELGRGDQEPLLPLTNANFERRPLDDALKHLVEQTHFSILVDPRVGDQAKQVVSAPLLNVPLDTAVRLLADMVDLDSVLQDNVLYVTTHENAARMRHEKSNRKGLVPGK